MFNLHEETQNETQNETSFVEALLGKAATLNIEEDGKGFYLSPSQGCAYVSTSRTSLLWGAPDLLIKYHGPLDIEVEADGFYNIPQETLIVIEGILGARSSNGMRKILTPEGSENVMMEKRESETKYSISINPKKTLEFIDSVLDLDPNDSTKTISMMPSKYFNNKSHFIGDLKVTRGINGDETVKVIPLVGDETFVLGDSLIELTPEEEEEIRGTNRTLFMFEYMGEVLEENLPGALGSLRKQVRLIMRYEPGIHMAIQDYPSGSVLPIFDSYSVIPRENNNSITSLNKTVLPFLEMQDKKSENQGPMLTYALSTFRAMLYAFQEYYEISINYDNSYNTSYVIGSKDEEDYDVEAIIAPLSNHRYGKLLGY